MAQLTVTEETERLPIGNLVQKTFRTTALGTNAVDEWIRTGLSTIKAIVGFATIGDAIMTSHPIFKKNAAGTGQTEGSSHGDLAVETGLAGQNVIEVTVLGLP